MCLSLQTPAWGISSRKDGCIEQNVLNAVSFIDAVQFFNQMLPPFGVINVLWSITEPDCFERLVFFCPLFEATMRTKRWLVFPTSCWWSHDHWPPCKQQQLWVEEYNELKGQPIASDIVTQSAVNGKTQLGNAHSCFESWPLCLEMVYTPVFNEYVPCYFVHLCLRKSCITSPTKICKKNYLSTHLFSLSAFMTSKTLENG